MTELAFTSKEVIAIINGGCLCTIGRGTCEFHGRREEAAFDAEQEDRREFESRLP